MMTHEVTIDELYATVHITCLKCKTEHTFVFEKQAYINWQTGMLIQNAFPTLCPDGRELLISGVCGMCFDSFFGNDNDLQS